MILTCPSCEKRFQVPDGALGESGRKVKCSSCSHVWFQAPVAPAGEAVKPEPAAEVVVPTPVKPVTAAPCPTTPDGDIAASLGIRSKFRPRPGDVKAIDDEAAAVKEADEAISDEAISDEAISDEAISDEAISDEAVSDDDVSDEIEERLREPVTDDGIVMPWPSQDDPARQAMPEFDVKSVISKARAPQREAKQRGGLWVLIVVLVLAVVILLGLYQWRDLVMRSFPQTIPAYVAAGLVSAPTSKDLKLENVAFEVRQEGGDKVLYLSGRVVNTGPEMRQLPQLRGELLDADGQVVSFWLFPADASVLGPGETTTFEDAYRNPPIGGSETDLFITFEDLR